MPFIALIKQEINKSVLCEVSNLLENYTIKEIEGVEPIVLRDMHDNPRFHYRVLKQIIWESSEKKNREEVV